MSVLFAAPVPVIVNTGSRAGQDLRADALREAFARHDIDADVRRVAGDRLDAEARRALDAGARVVVAAGGDGTVNAIAAHAVDRDDVALGVLPVGTLNHFARDLGLPDDLDEAVGVIARGHARTVDVGDVNGRLFLNNASLGLYARMVEKRERLQHHQRLGKWRAMLRASLSVLRHPHAFSVVLHVDGEALRRRTPFVFIGNNDYVVQGPRAGARGSLQDGELAAYVLRPCGTWGLIGLALRALAGRLSDGRDLDAIHATSLLVESHHAHPRLARDGEVESVDTPVLFRIRPRALRVYAPEAG
ncbi:MAG TPA: diacylglycerol kinase family protein [Lysobacter sp.]|nr:diacylglycerol kinase family protein [Lysobacter sp.]